MQTDDRLGTFADIAEAAGALHPVLDAVRVAVGRLHPDVFETASRRESSIWWGWGPRKMKAGYAYAIPFEHHVNLGFFQGVHLPDPDARLEGTGKTLRHVKLRSTADVMDPAITALIEAARDERQAALSDG